MLEVKFLPCRLGNQVEEGGPEVLEETANEKRSLLLCYPDDFEGETESLGLRCIHAFEGDVVRQFSEDRLSVGGIQRQCACYLRVGLNDRKDAGRNVNAVRTYRIPHNLLKTR